MGAKASTRKAPKKVKADPVRYSDELGEKICEQLSQGVSLQEICKAPGMPVETAVRKWARDPKHPFSAHYTRARELGYLKMAEELLDIADDGSNDWMERRGDNGELLGWRENGEAIARSRLRVDTRKWILAKMLPKVYGDKVMNELSGPDGKPIAIDAGPVDKVDLARKIIHLMQSAKTAQTEKS